MSHRFEIRRTVALPSSPEEVWEAVATAHGHAAWFMAGPDDPDPATLADVCDPPHRLRLPVGDTQMLEFLIDADAGGTAVLRLVHGGTLDTGGMPDGWGDEFDAMNGAGWDMYLHTLGAYLRHFAGRRARYVEAEAPGPGAWPAVVAALGSPAGTGAVVELDLGDTRLRGEVDYLTDRFLGLRTDGALVRFHERSAIGLPVAVSHHDVTGADPDALTRAWAERLAGWTPAPERTRP